MRPWSIGVTPISGFSVSAVPPPTKPARSVPPGTGLPDADGAPPVPGLLELEPLPQAAASSGDAASMTPAAPRSRPARDMRKSSSWSRSERGGCWSVTGPPEGSISRQIVRTTFAQPTVPGEWRKRQS